MFLITLKKVASCRENLKTSNLCCR